jgi:hypothetical protein
VVSPTKSERGQCTRTGKGRGRLCGGSASMAGAVVAGSSAIYIDLDVNRCKFGSDAVFVCSVVLPASTSTNARGGLYNPVTGKFGGTSGGSSSVSSFSAATCSLMVLGEEDQAEKKRTKGTADPDGVAALRATIWHPYMCAEELLRLVRGKQQHGASESQGDWLLSWVGATGERAGRTVMGYTGWRDVTVASPQRIPHSPAASGLAVQPSMAGLSVLVNTGVASAAKGAKGAQGKGASVGRGGANFVVGVSGVPSSRRVYGGHLVHTMDKRSQSATEAHSFMTYLTIDVCAARSGGTTGGSGGSSSGRSSGGSDGGGDDAHDSDGSRCGCSALPKGSSWSSVAENEGWAVSWIDVTADYGGDTTEGAGATAGSCSERGWVGGSTTGWDSSGTKGGGTRHLRFSGSGARSGAANDGEWVNFERMHGVDHGAGNGHAMHLDVDIGTDGNARPASAFVASLQGVGLPKFGPCVHGAASVAVGLSSGTSDSAPSGTFGVYLGSQMMSVAEAPAAAAAAATGSTVAVAESDRAWPCSELFDVQGMYSGTHLSAKAEAWKVVYIGLRTQDCVLSRWKIDGATPDQPYVCSRSCGDGHMRWRRRVVQQARGGGVECKSARLMKQENCNHGPCPVDCKLSAWSLWG